MILQSTILAYLMVLAVFLDWLRGYGCFWGWYVAATEVLAIAGCGFVALLLAMTWSDKVRRCVLHAAFHFLHKRVIDSSRDLPPDVRVRWLADRTGRSVEFVRAALYPRRQV